MSVQSICWNSKEDNSLDAVREKVARGKVVREAYEWLGTPFHDCARVKGRQGGVDCVQLLIAVYANAGQIESFETGHYSPQWHLHRGEEKYLLGNGGSPGVLHFAREIGGTPSPGDMVLFHFGRAWSHGAVIVQWPIVIHAWFQTTVTLANAERDEELRSRERRFFTLKEWK